jgi:hypothetical protein
MKRIAFFLTLFCLLNSCASLSSFYKPYIDVKTLNDVVVLEPDAEPEVFLSNNLNNDIQDILSEHYYCIGCTSFNNCRISEKDVVSMIKRQCKAVGATLAVYNINYAGTEINTISLPRTAYHRRFVYENHRLDAFSITERSTEWKDYTYKVRRYDYNVYYFVRFTSKSKLRFGIEYKDLTSEIRRKYKRNKGVFVDVVYKRTPAFNENILVGDIIIKINGEDINNVDDIEKFLSKSNSGDLLEIELQRECGIQTVKLRLG